MTTIIESLKNELESERETETNNYGIKFLKGKSDIELANTPTIITMDAYYSGHEAATARLLPLIEQAVEVIEFYGKEDNWHGYKHWDTMMIDDDYEVSKTNDNTEDTIEVAGKKAREFLNGLRSELEKEQK